MTSLWRTSRPWVFAISLAMSAAALIGVPFFGRWSAKLGYAAYASDTLLIWLHYMGIASVVALFGSLFGRGPLRIVALFLGLVEVYFWFVLSIAY